MNELAEKLHMDPTVLRDQNMVKEGMFMPAYLERRRMPVHWIAVWSLQTDF